MSVATRYLSPAVVLAVVWLARPAQAQEAQNPPPQAVTRPAQGLLMLGFAEEAPYSFVDKDGKITGFDVDVIDALAKKIGKKITVKLLPRAKALQAVQDGEADGLIGYGLPAGDNNLNDWIFTGPTTQLVYSLVVPKDVNWVTGLPSLYGMRVGVLQGEPTQQILQSGNEPRLGVVPVGRPRAACVMLQSRYFRALVADQNVIRYTARTSKIKGLKFAGVQVLDITNFGPAIYKKNGDAALAGELKAAVKALRADGTLARLETKWFAYTLNPIAWYQKPEAVLGMWVGSAVVVFALVLLLWSLSVRRGVFARTRRLTGELEVLRKHLADMESRSTAPLTHRAPQGAAELDQAAPAMTVVELSGFLNQSMHTVQQTAGANISVALEAANGLPEVLASNEELNTILLNLVANARDAIMERRADEPDAPAKITVLARLAGPADIPPSKKDQGQVGAFVALGVRDSGCGVPQDQVPKLFHAGYTSKPNASGQGLTLVYRIVAELGGWIDVESAPKRGASFSIFLPAMQAGSAKTGAVEILE